MKESALRFALCRAMEPIHGPGTAQATLLRAAGLASVPANLAGVIVAAEAELVADTTLAYQVLTILEQRSTCALIYLTQPGETVATGLLGSIWSLPDPPDDAAVLLLTLERSRSEAGGCVAAAFAIHGTMRRDASLLAFQLGPGINDTRVLDSASALAGVLKDPTHKIRVWWEKKCDGPPEFPTSRCFSLACDNVAKLTGNNG